MVVVVLSELQLRPLSEADHPTLGLSSGLGLLRMAAGFKKKKHLKRTDEALSSCSPGLQESLSRLTQIPSQGTRPASSLRNVTAN